MKRLLVALSLLFAISCASDYTCYVDPFIRGYHLTHDEVMQGGELRFVMKK